MKFALIKLKNMTVEIKCPPHPFQAAERAAEKQNDRDIKITNPNPANISTIFFWEITQRHCRPRREILSKHRHERSLSLWKPHKTQKMETIFLCKSDLTSLRGWPKSHKGSSQISHLYISETEESCLAFPPQLCVLEDAFLSPMYPKHTHTHFLN